MDQATKSNIHAALRLLAEDSEAAREKLRLSVGPEVDDLRRAGPDDVVILAFSGHGHTEKDGRFFLRPSDSGPHARIEPEDLPSLISSDELSEWLRRVDAGKMVMIIDACYAAEATAGEEGAFRPGPMGDRGLGQLAYDKGMRILAATQAGDVALESDALGQGLLTYALVRDGLDRRRADLNRDGTITLWEWLKYGETRVPTLYDDVRAGRVKLIYRGQVITTGKQQTSLAGQTPHLFDFDRGAADLILRNRGNRGQQEAP
jgi:uncharacterized caspase-like protein